MKCPKCGYTSFEYLNVCKKCNKDLTLHKDTYGIVAEAHGTINILSFITLESEVATEPAESPAEEPAEQDELVLSKEPEVEAVSPGLSQLEEISLDEIEEISLKEEETPSLVEEAKVEVTLDEEAAAAPLQMQEAEVTAEPELSEIKEIPEEKPEEIKNVEISVDEIEVQPEIEKESEASAYFEQTSKQPEMGGESDISLDDFDVLSEAELERAASQAVAMPDKGVVSAAESSVVLNDKFDLSLDLGDSFEEIKDEHVDSIFEEFSQTSDKRKEDTHDVSSEKVSEEPHLSDDSVEISLSEIDFLTEDIKTEGVIDQIQNLSGDVKKRDEDDDNFALSFDNFKLETLSEDVSDSKKSESLNKSSDKQDTGSDGMDIVLETLENASGKHEPIELFDQIDLAEEQNQAKANLLLAKEEEKPKEIKSKKKNIAAVEDEVNINLEDLYPDLDSNESDNS